MFQSCCTRNWECSASMTSGPGHPGVWISKYPLKIRGKFMGNKSYAEDMLRMCWVIIPRNDPAHPDPTGHHRVERHAVAASRNFREFI